jgi:hypothetical protein
MVDEHLFVVNHPSEMASEAIFVVAQPHENGAQPHGNGLQTLLWGVSVISL